VTPGCIRKHEEIPDKGRNYGFVRQRLTRAALLAIAVISCIPDVSSALEISAKEQFYRAESLNWLEYIDRFRDVSPDTSFDVTFYDIDVDIRIDTPLIQGRVECDFIAAEGNLDNITLELHHALSIDSITGNIDNYAVDNDTVKIALDRTYQVGEAAGVTVYYQGVPEEAGGYKGLRYETHAGNEVIIASLSTPYLAHYWWPCKDGPGDKPDSVYIDIAIPDTVINGNALIATSNGVLDRVLTRDGKKIFQWRERYPIVPYYVMVAISNYRHFQETYDGGPGASFSLDYYVFEESYSSAVQGLAQLPEAIQLFSSYFGAYPFETEKYGMSQLGYYGAIENQTNTIQNNMSLAWFNTSVHELSHMWFGDMITCRDWHHGWLNEGFATYAEALWAEHTGGAYAYRSNMATNEYWDGGTVYLEDVSDPYGGVFVDIIYRKGAYVLHMLRGVLGDSTFFDALEQYAQSPEYRYGHAVTEDFQKVCETVSGMDLDFFFDQWIYDEYYPGYEYGYWQDPATLETRVTIEQTQQNLGRRSVFEMPVQLTFDFTSGGDTLVTVWNDSIVQDFTFDFSGRVSRMSLDPDKWILRTSSAVGWDDTETKIAYPGFYLDQNFPNPFNPSTAIPLDVPADHGIEGAARVVTLTVYDIRGRRVVTLLDRKLDPGHHTVTWNGRDDRDRSLSSGVFLYTLRIGDDVATRKMIMIK